MKPNKPEPVDSKLTLGQLIGMFAGLQMQMQQVAMQLPPEMASVGTPKVIEVAEKLDELMDLCVAAVAPMANVAAPADLPKTSGLPDNVVQLKRPVKNNTPSVA